MIKNLSALKRNKKIFIEIPESNLNFYIIKTFIEYDGISLSFACKDDKKQLYIFMETDDEKSFESWGVIKISRRDYKNLCTGKISFQEIYEKYRDVFFKVYHYYETGVCTKVNTELTERDMPGDVFYSDKCGLFSRKEYKS